jgi:hypothetical protein
MLAYWAIIYVGQLLKFTKDVQYFDYLYTMKVIKIYFDQRKMGYIHFGRFFHRLIWSPWAKATEVS